MTDESKNGPYYQTQAEIDAYHQGQWDGLRAAEIVLERYWLGYKAVTEGMGELHPAHVNARHQKANGMYFALERVRYLLGGRIPGIHVNINQRIKAELEQGDGRRSRPTFFHKVRPN